MTGDLDNSHYEAEANLDHAAGVTNECLQGRCANCWDDDCACPMCGHPGYAARQEKGQ